MLMYEKHAREVTLAWSFKGGERASSYFAKCKERGPLRDPSSLANSLLCSLHWCRAYFILAPSGLTKRYIATILLLCSVKGELCFWDSPHMVIMALFLNGDYLKITVLVLVHVPVGK